MTSISVCNGNREPKSSRKAKKLKMRSKFERKNEKSNKKIENRHKKLKIDIKN